MKSRHTGVLSLVVLVAAISIVLIGLLVPADSAASYIGSGEKGIDEVQALRVLVVCVGVSIAVLATLSLVFPARWDKFRNLASQLGEKFRERRYYLSFCIACFLIALALGLLFTRSGAGISPDSMDYIWTGENVHLGNGFEGVKGEPYTHQPPLYPLAIASAIYLGVDAEQAARLIPILCFALLMFPIFFLGKTVRGVHAGYLACLLCLAFTPLLWVTSYAWTEMPFILFSVLAVFFLAKFSESTPAKSRFLYVAGMFSAVAILTRSVGATLLLVGLLVVVVKYGSRFRRTVHQAFVFGLIACVPMIPWLYRNMTLTSDISGGSWQKSAMGVPHILDQTVAAVVGDFFPDPLSQKILSYWDYSDYALLATAIIGLIALGLYVRSRGADGKTWWDWLGRNYVPISFVVIYAVTLILIRAVWGTTGIYSRFLVPIYPLLLLSTGSFLLYAYQKARGNSFRPVLFSIIALLCLSFLVVHGLNSAWFYDEAKDGQAYSDPYWHNHEGVAWIDNNLPEDAAIYSNRSYAIVWILDRTYHTVPHSGDDVEIAEFLQELENDRDSFVVGFKETPWAPAPLLTNMEIEELNREYEVLDLVDDFDRFTVWRVRE